MPHDTTSVPLAPAESVLDAPESPPLLALPCVIDGQDARSCPKCGRTFRMKESFAGKTIRCRGCRVSFCVRATERFAAGAVEPAAAPMQPNGAVARAAPSRPVSPAPVMRPPPPPAPPPLPKNFEDIGDVVDDPLPDETVPSVVRPRPLRRLSKPAPSPVRVIIEVFLGGAVTVPLTLAILWFGLGRDPFGVFRNPPPPAPDPALPPPAPLLPPPTPPLPPPPPPPPPPTFDAAEFEQSIREIHLALQREDFTDAERAVAAAHRHSKRDEEASSRAKRWALFTKYAKMFPEHRAQALENANKGREYEIDGEKFVVVEVGPDEIVYRRGGRRVIERRSAIDRRVEMAIVGKWFAAAGAPANHILLGVRWLCLTPPDVERGRQEWQVADERGAPVGALLPLLHDPVLLGSGP